MTPLSSDETPPDGTAIKNECRVRLYAKNYSKTVKTSKHGTYAFTDVPTLRGIKVEIESAVHRHTHKGVERSVEYMSCDSEMRVDHGAETIFGFVKPRKDKGEWHIGPTLYGKPSPTPTPRFLQRPIKQFYGNRNRRLSKRSIPARTPHLNRSRAAPLCAPQCGKRPAFPPALPAFCRSSARSARRPAEA